MFRPRHSSSDSGNSVLCASAPLRLAFALALLVVLWSAYAWAVS